MPRSPRIHAPGAMYHVTLRGNHRQDIFVTPDDRSLLTHIIRDILVDCGAQLHAYCYMTNHVHALLQVSDTPLSKIMLLVAGRYARRVQARLETTGHLFEKRYHALLVDADEYLLSPASIHPSQPGARKSGFVTGRVSLVQSPCVLGTAFRTVGHDGVCSAHARLGSPARDCRLRVADQIRIDRLAARPTQRA